MTTSKRTAPPSDPEGPTGVLCDWVAATKFENIPDSIRERAKHIVLDGMACALVGAHLPWSEKAVKAVSKMEMPGPCTIAGWDNKTFGPLASALLNSTFIQAFELDDYHSEAPLHSEAIIIPALLAAAEHTKASESEKISGAQFLLSAIVGFEVGPRIGRSLYGANVLSKGWHSGPLFGHIASAAAVSRLLNFTAAATEDAIGTAATQTCGLMSAQFESDTKRMQHGFASRNGLFAALISKEDFIGIKQVIERPYGGYLSVFSQGNGKAPAYDIDAITKDLGTTWETEGINIKAYASMGGTHPTIDCVRILQEKYPDDLSPESLNLDNIMAIEIDLGEAPFEHGGWQAARPMPTIGSQMNNAYCAATQLVDGHVFVEQFASSALDRDQVWNLVDKTTCRRCDDFPNWKTQRVTVQMADGRVLQQQVQAPRGVNPKLENQEVIEKAHSLVRHVDPEKWARIEECVLNIEKLEDVSKLGELLRMNIRNPLA